MVINGTPRNQAPPLESYNLFTSDRALFEGVAREAPGLNTSEISQLGQMAGTPTLIGLGFEANNNPPELITHNRYGDRIDEVKFHPAWHTLLMISVSQGLNGYPWFDKNPSPHTHRAAKFFMMSQVEAGHGCPLSMTYAAVPVVAAHPEIGNVWAPKFSKLNNPAFCGMGMTEKQGGSDVRANLTRATKLTDGSYTLEGHKWFCSAPQSDAFLVLAQADGGLSCFFVPRVLPDGSRNPFALQRLKEKLGNRSNASSEVEFHGTIGWLLGEEGCGIQTIVEMVNHTRLDCVIGSAALLRQALAQAIHHAKYRHTFGKLLYKHILMQNVLADIALESEAATVLWLRLARAVDDSASNEHAAALKRIGTAIGKYYVCKRAPAVSAEALECLGGNGYVEESIMPRLYREAPLNSIWEGSGNINALDILRILSKQPDAMEVLRIEFTPALSDRRFAHALQQLETELADSNEMEWRARSIVERMALLWQASLLLQHAPNYVSDGFIASRIAGDWGRTMGTLPIKTALRGIVDRAAPGV